MHTFGYWYKMGYAVMAGQRHVRRNRYGEPLFAFAQVTPIVQRRRVRVVYYYD